MAHRVQLDPLVWWVVKVRQGPLVPQAVLVHKVQPALLVHPARPVLRGQRVPLVRLGLPAR